MRIDSDEDYTIAFYLEQRTQNDTSYIAIYHRKDFIDDTHRALTNEEVPLCKPGSCSFIDPNNKLQSLVAVVEVLL